MTMPMPLLQLHEVPGPLQLRVRSVAPHTSVLLTMAYAVIGAGGGGGGGCASGHLARLKRRRFPPGASCWWACTGPTRRETMAQPAGCCRAPSAAQAWTCSERNVEWATRFRVTVVASF